MKKMKVLLTLALSVVCLSGCDFISDIFDNKDTDKPTGKDDKKVKVESVQLSETSINIETRSIYQIEWTVLPENANQNVVFQSDDQEEEYISVSESGSVYAVAEGEANVSVVSAEDRTKYSVLHITISDPVLDYTVTFNANGGTQTMEPDTTDGYIYVTPECLFEKEGYHFTGWSLERGDDVEFYGIGATIYNINSNIELIANWELDTVENYTVSFNSNTGVGTMASVETNGSTFVVPECEFTKKFYTFNEWALNNVEGKTYSVGSSITNISSDITLYALWQEQNFVVSFDANGGSGNMPNQATQGFSYEVPGCLFEPPTGMVFDCWTLNSTTGTHYNAGSTISNVKSDIKLYANWKEGSSDTYYAACAGLSGSSLQSTLKSINEPKNPNYDWSRYEDADEALDDPTCILSIYTRHNIKKSNHCGGNYSWDKWNREHVWTQTSYPRSKTDNHNIFACEGQINGYRGDKPFAEGGDTVVVFGHTTGCKQTKSTFEPCDEAKGEIARSVMYGTVQYSYTMTDEIDSIYLALKWHIEHPITERDIRRNEVVFGNQGNRNPFVDHPEYACKIWGNTNDQTRTICGMK